ncbi:transcriptional regulator, Sir2 family protein [Cryptosporidium muris RN66]|uniref:Transcriptional regulator, Sir2 family protein n=1 Tax=Cryptosporidium muris (strain RN66) TaxID=441375 RepID=B6AFN0_CRYMR|nr:transcriptional regulator, Sir2 family protein [Cryptosporidium muris RN66]EEA07021.1 transcriptional regulator, Sir2 family protein [Cryptosporidium muris RN66]|eukprot:XP_002141370.1 transcriptional regulator, Sir2 family protein [Cryptosporidium muris RN66]
MQTRSQSVLSSLKSQILNTDDKILFITGAGLSFDSGIPLFRSEHGVDDSSVIWDDKMESWATMKTFLLDPLSWYSIFKSKYEFFRTIRDAKPNKGHRALSWLCKNYPDRIKIITQNIDGLLHKANCPPENVLEVHGRLDYLRCSNTNCYLSKEQYLPLDWNCLENKSPKAIIQDLACPSCNSPCLPLVLLFDEPYHGNKYYQWDKAKEWMNEADLMIFVGTSFSVFCTDKCLRVGYKKNLPIVNINIRQFPITFEIPSKYNSDSLEILEYPCELVRQIIQGSTDALLGLIPYEYHSEI